MAGIHVFFVAQAWMAGTSPAMTFLATIVAAYGVSMQ